MEVKDEETGIYTDPTDYLDGAGYTITSAGPAVEVYGGHTFKGRNNPENRAAYMQSEAFMERFFGQPIEALGQSFTSEMLTVMRANNLFESASFAAMGADTVLPYLREWYPKASPVEKQKMLEIARRSNPGGYEEWKKLPPYAQQFILP